ncbi:uncharacterized protein BDR25DRAFT_302880 [Lindgomyces ingoldianus]|uniref:Uncharacterized protein n=1 Tax=Lindgomyces ingoldianus TaxID=673940 RepID=A0ACB6QYV0_9PLEO|nr:uncharacterized protein BDR25DRAFT_302880 [Lindgomyces ingoldianus]KAF2472096.1 hypothetical protein BDR25DRAFT_302880 [Lindgomyces ingoldianus]
MPSLSPCTISVLDSALKKLDRKLSDADFPDEFDDVPVQWPYVAPLSDVDRQASY